MQKYATFNHDQLSVLRSQLQSVVEQLEWLGDGIDDGGFVSIDLAGFTNAVASLTTTVQQASRDFVDVVVDAERRAPTKTRKPKPTTGTFACCAVNCRSRKHYARGLCRKCYTKVSKQVREGELRWEDLEKRGRAKPPRKESDDGAAQVLSVSTETGSGQVSNLAG